MAKQYGLIKADKSKVIQRPSIFNSDSDSDNEPEKPTGISSLKKKERMAQEKAVADDPTIYQYDELYDDMQSKRKESKLARKDLDKKPKYINKLLESAERRKRENERRIERQVQKEREEEGDMFKDKESFVTTAYKKKLEELKELEEKEKREDYLESIGDVKKQSDLSGFYRHLYAQQVNSDEDKSESESFKSKDTNKQTTVTSDVKNKVTSPDKTAELTPPRNITKKRKYRKRETSHSDQSEDEKPKLEHLPSNIDADSDFSIDSDSETSDKELETKKIKIEADSQGDKTIDKIDASLTAAETNEASKEKTVEGATETEIKQEIKEDIKPVVPKKPKVDIWKKRTVGAVFDDALRRFYERKSAKIQTVN